MFSNSVRFVKSKFFTKENDWFGPSFLTDIDTTLAWLSVFTVILGTYKHAIWRAYSLVISGHIIASSLLVELIFCT